MAVSARGRIPASVVEQYQAATKGHWHTPRSRPAKPRPDHPGGRQSRGRACWGTVPATRWY